MKDKQENLHIEALRRRKVFEVPYTKQIQGFIRVKAESMDEACYMVEDMHLSDVSFRVGEIKEVYNDR